MKITTKTIIAISGSLLLMSSAIALAQAVDPDTVRQEINNPSDVTVAEPAETVDVAGLPDAPEAPEALETTGLSG